MDENLSKLHASKETKDRYAKIKKAWRYNLPKLKRGLHFVIEGRNTYFVDKKRKYKCEEDECDMWSSLFEHSPINTWFFKFALDSPKVDLDLDRASVSFSGKKDIDAWNTFLEQVEKNGREANKEIPLLNETQKTNIEGFDSHLFSDKDGIHPWFICRTENLGLDALMDLRAFGVSEAGRENPDYIPKTIDNIDGKVSNFIQAGENVLVCGPPGVGKTRYVYNELSKINGHYVISFKDDDIISPPKSFSMKFQALKKDKLIWLIDDFHYFNGKERSLDIFYQNLINSFNSVTIVATLRIDKNNYKESRIRNTMHLINISLWDEEDIRIIASAYNIFYDKVLPSAPLYLFKDMSKLKKIYQKYEKEDRDCLWLLRYIKLITSFSRILNYPLLKKTYLYLREQKQTTDEFEISFNKIEEAGFVAIRNNFVKTWDLVLNKMNIKNEYSDFNDHLYSLIPFFSESNNFGELWSLGNYFHWNNLPKHSMRCFKLIIENETFLKNNPDNNLSYLYLGLALSHFGEHKKAIEVFKEALVIDPADDIIHYNIGVSWGQLNEYEKALCEYNQAIHSNPEMSVFYAFKSDALIKLGRYEEALIECKKAISINPANVMAYCKLATIFENRKEYNKAFMNIFVALLAAVIERDWEVAYRVILKEARKLLDLVDFNESRKMGAFDALFVFQSGLEFILFSDQKVIKKQKDLLKNEFRDMLEFIRTHSTKSYLKIIADALIEGKPIKMKFNIENEGAEIYAATILANEIVNRSRTYDL